MAIFAECPDGKAPSFLVAALRDPMSGNLDRIQIVKVWVDGKGDRHEKVFEAVWSGDREPGADGKLPLVGNTVDVASATWTNTIGAPELITVWTDPEFDASVSARLLRTCAGDSDAALDCPRSQAFRDHNERRDPDDHGGACLHLTDLVHALM